MKFAGQFILLICIIGVMLKLMLLGSFVWVMNSTGYIIFDMQGKRTLMVIRFVALLIILLQYFTLEF